MIVKPSEFGMIQQMNNVSQVSQNENNRPIVEHQNMVQQMDKEVETKAEQVQQKDGADNSERSFDARDKSDNEYYQDGKSKKKKVSDGRVIIKGHGNTDFDIKV